MSVGKRGDNLRPDGTDRTILAHPTGGQIGIFRFRCGCIALHGLQEHDHRPVALGVALGVRMALEHAAVVPLCEGQLASLDRFLPDPVSQLRRGGGTEIAIEQVDQRFQTIRFARVLKCRYGVMFDECPIRIDTHWRPAADEIGDVFLNADIGERAGLHELVPRGRGGVLEKGCGLTPSLAPCQPPRPFDLVVCLQTVVDVDVGPGFGIVVGFKRRGDNLIRSPCGGERDKHPT